MLWDIFCRVIDNFGDIGVCWRLSAQLAERGERVRLWVDDPSALRWMAPGALEGAWPGVQVLAWEQAGRQDTLAQLVPADVWIEAFGCELPQAFVAHHAGQPQPVWINLEYLSAEDYVERSHGLPSPVMQGLAKGWTKWFFYPGFSDKTGGLLREPTIRSAPPDTSARQAFFAALGIPWQGEPMVSLFCYEPPGLEALVGQLAASGTASQLLVTPGRATQAVQALLGKTSQVGLLQIRYLSTLPQTDFGRLLDHCDLNFVRGEDSVVRALWAGRPFVWQIYPQHDQAHADKLEAFLQQLQLGEPVRSLHRVWNGLQTPADPPLTLPTWQGPAHLKWQTEVQTARARLLQSNDLLNRLLEFVKKNR